MEITSSELKEKINEGGKFVVDFWTPWCGPCRVTKPIFEKVGKQLKEDNSEVTFYSVDVQTYPDAARDLGIRNIPTIKSFNGGKEVESRTGVLQEEQLNEMVKTLLNG